MGLSQGLPGRDRDESTPDQQQKAPSLPGREREESAPVQQQKIPTQPQQQRSTGLIGWLLSWLINRFLRRT